MALLGIDCYLWNVVVLSLRNLNFQNQILLNTFNRAEIFPFESSRKELQLSIFFDSKTFGCLHQVIRRSQDRLRNLHGLSDAQRTRLVHNYFCHFLLHYFACVNIGVTQDNYYGYTAHFTDLPEALPVSRVHEICRSLWAHFYFGSICLPNQHLANFGIKVSPPVFGDPADG